ncbi:oxidoreductase [Longimicrobium sp.]|uniref:oxidoreductase n=1 Tax=Longimicrobium sp. TaxID=2029185 RepID=UPI002CE00056|nr:oxidoreductase [Longimicrobium sp.]HSU16767.1 oxidoreductase [Longimicrobium sp.]
MPAADAARGRTALVLGATGLVGGHCVDLLLADPAWERVTTIGRRSIDREHPKLVQRLADLGRLEEEAGDAFAVDDVFCCLGTTIRKAGSREAFMRVDHDYPVAAATLASRRGARRFFLVSSLGADAGSRVFYNRVKGEVERDVAAVPFEGVALVRPSLMLGPRIERRIGERVAQVVMPLFSPVMRGPLRKYRAIDALAVARAMVRLARASFTGVRIVESDELQRLGG